MRAFRVALYCSSCQDWDLPFIVEDPRPLFKVSQPMDFPTCERAVEWMRPLHRNAIGIVADTRQMVEFYSQPQRAFTVHLGKINPAEEVALAAAQMTSCPAMLQPPPQLTTMQEILATAEAKLAAQLTGKTLSAATAAQLNADFAAKHGLVAPLTPPPPVPQQLSPEKLPWWERLLIWVLGKRGKEACCGK